MRKVIVVTEEHVKAPEGSPSERLLEAIHKCAIENGSSGRARLAVFTEDAKYITVRSTSSEHNNDATGYYAVLFLLSCKNFQEMAWPPVYTIPYVRSGLGYWFDLVVPNNCIEQTISYLDV